MSMYSCCFKVKRIGDRARSLHAAQLEEAASRLRRDLLCASCQLGYNNRKRHGLSVTCKFSAPKGDGEWLHCSGCQVDHLSTVFSCEEKMKPCSERLCLGRQGYVRLCEHDIITWAEIEALVIQACKEPTSDPWTSIDLRSCRTPNPELARRLNRNVYSHHEAFICISGASKDTRPSVGLTREWLVNLKPTTVPSIEPSEPLSASEMRAMAQILRLEEAASMVPAEGPSHLPEMDCFDGAWHCTSSWWDMEESAKQAPSQSGTIWPWDHICSLKRTGPDAPCPGQHTAESPFRLPSQVTITTERGLPLVSESDLRFKYTSTVRVSNQVVYGTDRATLVPNHNWYHAMDRSSYSWQGGCGARESCENQSCRNYYNLAVVSSCSHPDISRTCECEREGADELED